jgi:hypothetical protein
MIRIGTVTLLLILASLEAHGLGSPLSFETSEIRCFHLALNECHLSIRESILLCTQAKSEDPIRCFREISQLLTPDQRISLCQGASSLAPVDCFEELAQSSLSTDQRTKLCNTASFRKETIRSSTRTAPAHCYVESEGLPLLKDQRVILCGEADSDNPVQCFIRTERLQLTPDQRVRLCTQLNPSSW